MSDNPSNLIQTSKDNQPSFLQPSQFAQFSVKEESVRHLNLHSQSKDTKQEALQFLSSYNILDENFPIETLKGSNNLKIKHYKESKFYGELENSKKHGWGIMLYNNQKIYQGQWENDKKRGYGAQLFPNGCFYKGNYQNGKPQGHGCYSWPNGQYYDGQWLNGQKHGSGMWRGAQGDSYKGEWRLGKPEGYGTHTFINGDIYQGEFKQCLKHGEGVEKFANGDMYRGGYANGKPTGSGVYYWENGSYFKGNFINGLRDGFGSWKRKVGHTSDKYQGNYRNDKKWGAGQFTWASGNIYKGNYEGDVRSGYGQMFWANGSHYKGQWVNGIQHGQGQIFIPGQGIKKGVFDNNVIVEVREEVIIPKKTVKSSNKSREKTLKSQYKRIVIKPNFRTKQKISQKMETSKRRQIMNKQMSQASFLQIPLQENPYKRSQRRNQLLKNNRVQDKNITYTSKFFENSSRMLENNLRSLNLDDKKQITKTNQSSRPKSKQRILHSSFYLYKLSMRQSKQKTKRESYSPTRQNQTNQNFSYY